MKNQNTHLHFDFYGKNFFKQNLQFKAFSFLSVDFTIRENITASSALLMQYLFYLEKNLE